MLRASSSFYAQCASKPVAESAGAISAGALRVMPSRSNGRATRDKHLPTTRSDRRMRCGGMGSGHPLTIWLGSEQAGADASGHFQRPAKRPKTFSFVPNVRHIPAISEKRSVSFQTFQPPLGPFAPLSLPNPVSFGFKVFPCNSECPKCPVPKCPMF